MYINSITLNFFTFNRNNGEQGSVLYADVSLADNAGVELACKTDQALAANGAFTEVEFNPENTSIATLIGSENASSDSFTVKVKNPSTQSSPGTFVGLKDITLVTSATIRSGANVTWTNGADATWSGESWKTTAGGTIGTMADANVGNATFVGVANDDSTINDYTVTVDAAATAQSIEVSSGNYTFAAGSYTVNGEATPGALRITNGMTINDGASATFNVATTLAGTVTNNGTLTFGSFTVEEGDTATFGGDGTTTLTSTVTNNGTLALNGTLNVQDVSTMEARPEGAVTYDGGQVDGNGFRSQEYILIQGGSITYDEDFKLRVAGSTVTPTVQSSSELSAAARDGSFHVFTGAETIGSTAATSYYVAKGGTLTFSDALTGARTMDITGTGTVAITIGSTSNHGNTLTASNFNGVLQISKDGAGNGNVKLHEYGLGDSASFKLISGNHWGGGGQNISKAIELAGEGVDDFAFRHDGSLELSGKVTGTYLTAGRNYGNNGVSNTDNTLTLSGAESKIQHVTMKGGTLTVNAGMTFGTLFANAVVLTNSAELDIGYTDDSGEVISGDSSINGSFTLNANTGLDITAGTMNVNGAVTNSGAITVSGGTADFTNTLGMEAGSSLSVSGGSATVSGTLSVTGAAVSLSQSGTGELNLKGAVSIAQNAGLKLSGVVGISSTIVNDGTLTLNDRLDLLGDIYQYTLKTAGERTYSHEGNQGFMTEGGAQYWLTQSSSDELAKGASVSFGVAFEKNEQGYYIVHYGDSQEFALTKDGNHYYFTTSTVTSTTFLVSNSTGLEVYADAASRATSFDMSAGSSMTLKAGAATNAGVTINAEDTCTINLEAGSTLNAFTKSGTGTITLTGSGTYVAERGNNVHVTTGSLQDSTNWTGTVQFTGDVSEEAGFDNRFGNAKSTIEMKGASGWFANNTTLSSTIKLTKDGEQNGFTVTAASPGWLLTIAGAVTGNGDFTINQSNTNSDPNYKFTGDLSGWSGAFVLAEKHNQTIDVEMSHGGDLFADVDGSGIKVAQGSKGTLAVVLGSDSTDDTNMLGAVINESTSADLNLTVQGNTNFNKDVTVTGLTVNNGKSATMKATLKAGNVTNNGELKLGTAATVTGGTMGNVTAQASGISAADTTDGAKGSISNTNVALAQLAEDASFTIQDMTLTNTTITATTPTTQVNFRNVTVVGATVLQNLQASMTDANVATGGSEGVKGVFTASTSLLSGITLVNTAGSTITVDLGDLSCAAPLDQGKYDLSITLSGFTMQNYSGLATGAGLVFAADSWLGSLLNQAQNVNVQMTIAQAEAGAAAAAEGGSASGVSYSTGNVGTIITITGLNVPEPATSTLSLLALAALAARRRRND